MGDVPRSEEEKSLLQKQIITHNRLSSSRFMVHVGDIKAGSTPCNEAVYAQVAGYLKELNVPTFIVPGDNEWNDCEKPDEAWAYWEKYFRSFEQNWDVPFKVEHQIEQTENFAFVIRDVVFIGLNLVGGKVHDQRVWDEKMQNDADWLKLQLQRKNLRAAILFAQANPNKKHDLFMKQFRKSARLFQKKILFVHGDGHRWLHDEPWLEKNITRIQVDKGGIADPLQISVVWGEQMRFQFNRSPFRTD